MVGWFVVHRTSNVMWYVKWLSLAYNSTISTHFYYYYYYHHYLSMCVLFWDQVNVAKYSIEMITALSSLSANWLDELSIFGWQLIVKQTNQLSIHIVSANKSNKWPWNQWGALILFFSFILLRKNDLSLLAIDTLVKKSNQKISSHFLVGLQCKTINLVFFFFLYFVEYFSYWIETTTKIFSSSKLFNFFS